MLILKVISGVTVAAFAAAVVLAMPGFSPQVEARAAAPAVKGDRLDARPLGSSCSQNAWPYYERACLRDRTMAPGAVRPAVRIVSVDRTAAR
jgi:hypothetical protein